MIKTFKNLLITLAVVSVLPAMAMAAPFIEYNELTSIDDSSATITWRTSNEASNTVIEYGISGYSHTKTISESVYYHSIKIDNLYPNTTYKYRIKSGTTYGPDQSFTTLSRPSGDYLFSFAVFADPQFADTKSATECARGRPYQDLADRIKTVEVAAIISANPDFVLMLGDAAEEGDSYGSRVTADYAPYVKSAFDAAGIPLYPIPGNHDKKATYAAGNWVSGNMGLLYPPLASLDQNSYFNYSFSHKGYHFIMLDSITNEAGANNGKGFIDNSWLQSELNANLGKKTFIFTHYPPYDVKTTGMSVTIEEETYDDGTTVIPLQMESAGRTFFSNVVESDTHKGDIAGVATGHVHDNFMHMSSAGFPYIRESSAVQSPIGYSIYKVYTNGYIHTFYKADPTISELARNYIVDDRGQNKLVWQQVWLGALSGRNFTHTYTAIDIGTPEVSIKSPASGSTKNGRFNLTCIATDEMNLGRVELFINNSLHSTKEIIGTSTYATFEVNTLSYSDGTYTLEVRAFDHVNNSSRESISVSFNNGIYYARVRVVNPNGSEIWQSRSTKNLRYLVSGVNLPVAPISLYYSTNNGASYALIASNLNTSETYAWTIPDLSTSQAKIKVICEGASPSYITSDESNSVFTILPYDTNPPQGVFYRIFNDTTQDVNPTFTGIATDESSPITSIECRVDDNEFTPAIPLFGAYTASTESFMFAVPQTLSKGNHTIYAKFKDAAGNESSSSQYASYAFKVVGVNPEIEMRLDGTSVVAGDPISAKPSIEAVVTSLTTLESIKLYINSNPAITLTKVPDPDNTYINYGFYTPTTPFTDGSYSIRIVAKDIENRQTSKEVTSLIVGDEQSLGILGAPLNYPNPFNPENGTYISYSLSKNAGIQLSIHDLTGNMIWKQNYASGTNGGRAGYNEIFWNGKSGSGGYCGNGIYVLVIVGDGKVIGRSKITAIK